MNMMYIPRLIVGLIFIALVCYMWFSGITDHITFTSIQRNTYYLQDIVAHHYYFAALCYIGAYIIFTVAALPVASLLTLTGGFLFGMVPGLLYTISAATIAATITFILFRYLLGDYVQDRYQEQLRSFNTSMHEYGGRYLLLIRLIPVIPFFIANMLASLTKVSLATFVITTTVGVMPVSALYSYAGQELGAISSIHDIMSAKFMIILGILILLALIPLGIHIKNTYWVRTHNIR